MYLLLIALIALLSQIAADSPPPHAFARGPCKKRKKSNPLPAEGACGADFLAAESCDGPDLGVACSSPRSKE